MAFLTKNDLEATIAKYQIPGCDGAGFAKKQGIVSKYLAANGLEPVHEEQKVEKPDDFAAALQAQFAAQDADGDPEWPVFPPQPQSGTPENPVLIRGKARRVQQDADTGRVTIEGISDLRNKRVVFAPEIRYDPNMIWRYEEDLGEDMEVEELWYNGETLNSRNIQAAPGQSNGVSGTYRVRLIPHSKLTATASVPRINAGIYWDFGPDGMQKTWFPIAVYEGRKGYLYSHSSIPCVKPVIIESGYYEDFKDQLQDEPNIFYLAGSIRAIAIPFCEWMMHEIENREVYKHGRHIR